MGSLDREADSFGCSAKSIVMCLIDLFPTWLPGALGTRPCREATGRIFLNDSDQIKKKDLKLPSSVLTQEGPRRSPIVNPVVGHLQSRPQSRCQLPPVVYTELSVSSLGGPLLVRSQGITRFLRKVSSTEDRDQRTKVGRSSSSEETIKQTKIAKQQKSSKS